MGTIYNTSANIEGRTTFAVMPTIHDVFGDKTSAFAKSTRSKLAAWAKGASKATGGAISPKALEKRFQVQHDLIFIKNMTVAELFPTNAGSAIAAQLWTSMPFSWGSIHLGAVDKIDEPIIDAGLMALDIDVEMSAGVARLSRNAYHSPPLSSLMAAEISPGEDVLPLNATDIQWAAFVRDTGKTTFVPKFYLIRSRYVIHWAS